MALPLPYAPNIDVGAERLRMAREEAAQPSVDVTAGVGPAFQGAMALKDVLEKGEKAEAAKIFQRDYLDKGLEGAKKLWEDAGKPAESAPDHYFYQGMTPEETSKAVLLYAKDLTGWRADKAEETGATAYADARSKGIKQDDGTYKPATQEELDALEVSVAPKGKKLEAVKGVADRAETRKLTGDKLKVQNDIATLRATTAKAVKGMENTLRTTKDAGVIKAIESNNDRITEVNAETDRLEGVLAGMSLYQQANDKVIAPKLRALEREVAAINAQNAGFTARVSDPSKIPSAIKKPEGGDTVVKWGKDPVTGLPVRVK